MTDSLPIVLVHGFPLDASIWQHQADFLRSRGRKVITPNLPGFGGAPARGQASMDSFAEVVYEAIQREADGKAIVGGFSMGGYVLMALIRAHPDCVAAAMFIDTRPDQDSAEAKSNRHKSIDEIKKNGPAGVIEGLLTKQFSKKPSPAAKALAKSIMERQPAPSIIAAQEAMLNRRDQTELLAGLSIPVLIVVGAEDSITPPSVALSMQSHMPHAMVAQIVSAGHMALIEQPAAVNSTIDAFLATVHEPVVAK